MPGIPPLGYINEVIDKTIIPDPDRFQLVRKMWDMMLTGSYNPATILETASNEWGFRTRKYRNSGNKELSLSGIYKLFNSIFYTGTIECKGKLYRGSHVPMITTEEFDYVQQILGRRGRPRPIKRAFAYTGLLRCHNCGHFYTAESKLKYIKAVNETKKFVYYHTSSRSKTKNCTAHMWIGESELENQILDRIGTFSIRKEFLDWALEILDREKPTEQDTTERIEASKESTVQKLESELSELTRMRYKGFIDDDEYLKERKGIEGKLGTLKGKSEQKIEEQDTEELTRDAFTFSHYCRYHFSAARDPQKRKEIVQSFGSNHTLRDGKLDFDANCWLEPIQKQYPEIEKRFMAIEPSKKLDLTMNNECLQPVILSWQGRKESDPRFWFWRPKYYHCTTPPRGQTILVFASLCARWFFCSFYRTS